MIRKSKYMILVAITNALCPNLSDTWTSRTLTVLSGAYHCYTSNYLPQEEHLRRNILGVLRGSLTRPEYQVVIEQGDMQPIAARIANFVRTANFSCIAPTDPVIRARCAALSEKTQNALRELRTEIDSKPKDGNTRELMILIKLMDCKISGLFWWPSKERPWYVVHHAYNDALEALGLSKEASVQQYTAPLLKPRAAQYNPVDHTFWWPVITVVLKPCVLRDVWAFAGMKEIEEYAKIQNPSLKSLSLPEILSATHRGEILAAMLAIPQKNDQIYQLLRDSMRTLHYVTSNVYTASLSEGGFLDHVASQTCCKIADPSGNTTRLDDQILDQLRESNWAEQYPAAKIAMLCAINASRVAIRPYEARIQASMYSLERMPIFEYFTEYHPPEAQGAYERLRRLHEQYSVS